MNARCPRFLAGALLSLAPLAATAASPHQHASTPAMPASPIAVALDPASLASLPHSPVTASAHGQTLHCEGVPLTMLLRAAGALPEQPLRGAALASYVLVDARDGYRVVYALAELEPTLGGSQAMLVDRCDGKPLDEQEGPLRLIAADEARPARWVRQVQSIAVVIAP